MMLGASGQLDLHTLLKACYFADKEHLNEHGRPVFGATYKAMRYGPVPLEVYEMAKCEPYWLPELNCHSYPWRLDGHIVRLATNEDIERVLSDSDIAAIDAGLTTSRSMTFNERTAATHGPDWQSAQLGKMKYEDMIVDGASKADTVRYLEQTGRYMKL